jgi:ribosomal protein L40E
VSTDPNKTATKIAVATLACSKCGAGLPEEAQFCSKCGKPVSMPTKAATADDSTGEEVSAPGVISSTSAATSSSESSSSISPTRRRSRRSRRLILWILFGFFLVAVVWAATSDNPFAQGIQELVGWKHDQTILDTPFSVSAHNFRYYKFALPEGSMNVFIVGQFAASSEAAKDRGNRAAGADHKAENNTDNNIEVYVLSEPAFTVWQNGYATSAVYESGRVPGGAVQAELPAGAGIYYLVFNNKFAPKAAKEVNATVLLRYKSWLPEWFRRTKDRFWNWWGL